MMSLKLAKTILSVGISKAKAMGRHCSIAIVDDRGWLVALHRMDGAPIPTADIARDKAWTAATFRMPSAEVSQCGDRSAPGYGFNVQSWNDRLTTIPGGLPILKEGHLIGAIGVCGETPKEDILLCHHILKDVFLEDKALKISKRIARKKANKRR